MLSCDYIINILNHNRMKELAKKTAVVDNRVILKNDIFEAGHFHLSHLAYDVVMFFISELDQEADDVHKQVILAKKLEEYLVEDGKKWGRMSEVLENVCNELLDSKIRFPRGYEVTNDTTGEKVKISGGINWFQYVVIMKQEGKPAIIEFCFSEILKHLLLGLKKKFVILNSKEVRAIRGGHSKHIYSILKMYRDKTRLHTPHCSTYRVEVEEFKRRLGIEGKYARYNDLNHQILKKAKANADSSPLSKIWFTYSSIREGRSIKYIEFLVYDIAPKIEHKKELHDYVPSEKEVDSLTMARRKAYQILIEYGVVPGIAVKQIIPSIGGGDIGGFEDVFLNYAIAHFEKKTNKEEGEERVGALVNWWMKNKAFDSKNGKDWARVIEQVIKEKKRMEKEEGEAFANRILAKDMSYTEFTEWYRENNGE